MNAHRHPIPEMAPQSPGTIVASRVRMIPAELAHAFGRAPLAFLVVAGFALAMPIASAKGITGAFDLPFIVALPMGVLGVAIQADAYAKLRTRSQRRSANLMALLVVSLCNMISVTAGIVALSPDSQGQAMIARALNPIIAAVQQRAAMLETIAGKYGALAQYSAQKAAQEGAPSAPEWQPTCPASTGPGVGPVTRWRLSTGEQASAVAAGLKTAADLSRRAAADAGRAAAAYKVNSHATTMAAIEAAIGSINRASGSLGGGTSTAFLDRIGTETADRGICPDAPMASLIADARNAARGGAQMPLTFTAPPKPSEAVSVRDLASQLFAVLIGGESDLSMYLRYLWIAPFADLVFMYFLAQVLPTVRRDYRAEAAERLGIDPAAADLIDTVAPEVEGVAEWQSLVTARQPVRNRFFAFDRILVAETDWSRLYRMREYVASGGAREGGPDGHGNIVFILRPHFLDELWRQLLRRALVGETHRLGETITILRSE